MKEMDYSSLQRWIPDTDVDGIDLKPEIASVLQNAILQNGFIKNAVAPSTKTLPTDVQVWISNGYELIAYTNFLHSALGFKELYILWQETGKRLNIHLGNETIRIREEELYTVCDEKPFNINFNLVNDELKINLNCTTTLLGEQIILNLTLLYLDEVVYIPGVTEFSAITFYPAGAGTNTIVVGGTETNGLDKHYEITISEFAGTPDGDFYKATYKVDGISAGEDLWITAEGIIFTLWTGITITFPLVTGYILGDAWTFLTTTSNLVRPEGWYLTPRWLGWQLHGTGCYLDNYYPINEFELEDFEDDTYITGFIMPPQVNTHWERKLIGTAYSLYLISGGGTTRTTPVKFTKLRNLKKIEMEIGYSGVLSLEIRIIDADGNQKTVTVIEAVGETVIPEIKTYEINEFSNKTFEVWFSASIQSYTAENGVVWQSYIDIPYIKLYPMESIVLGKTAKGQRAFLTTGKPSKEKFGLSVFGGTEQLQIKLQQGNLDFRFILYEIYVRFDTIYYLKSKIVVESGAWTLMGTELTGLLSLVDEDDPVETLNFNYGLGTDIRVDSQHLIHDEVSFNNRIYTVNGGYQVRQTHIAGNGKIQPDSFPYSEENNYGYIEESKSSSVQSLLVINNNFLIMFLLNGFSLYAISPEVYRSALRRELRLLASSFTEYNPKSLTKITNSISPTIGMYWVTREGLWFHDGSAGSIPVNLISGTHLNYWRSLVNTNNFGFYDYQDNEYWYATEVYEDETDDSYTTFLVYEISYKTFRLVRLPEAYQECVGYHLGLALLRTSSGIVYLKKLGGASLPAIISTHYNNMQSDYTNKIAQELYINLKNRVSGSIVATITFDDRWSVSYTISSSEMQIRRLFPISIRFKRAKISLSLINAGVTLMNVSNFGIRFTEDGAGRLGEILEHDITIEPVGYGRAYGRYYGGTSVLSFTGYGRSYGTNYGK